MTQPTITVRISAHPIMRADNGEADPLVELVGEETIIYSVPAIHQAVTDFVKRNRPVRLGKVTVQRV